MPKSKNSKWHHEAGNTNAITEYRDDATFVGDRSVERFGEVVKIKVSGRWKITDGASSKLWTAANQPQYRLEPRCVTAFTVAKCR